MAFCAMLWCAKKFSSKLLRSTSSETSPILPCQAAPALEMTISTPPNVLHTVSNAARTDSPFVTSQVTAIAEPPTVCAEAVAADSSMSKTAISAPIWPKAAAVAAPIPLPPPVTKATCPASSLSGVWPSLACSRDQYSISNRSASLADSNLPMASASVTVSMVLSAMSAAILASFAVRPTPKSPTPGTSTTRGTGSSFILGWP